MKKRRTKTQIGIGTLRMKMNLVQVAVVWTSSNFRFAIFIQTERNFYCE
jgi:hypothetical protein